MPKLEKMSSEEHINISKKMFYGGFAFLPFLWLVNFMYFFNTIRQPNAPKTLKNCKCSMNEKKNAKTDELMLNLIDVYWSLGGCVIWFIILTTWYGLFVNKRTAWGQGADRITVVIPKGL
jgi:presenilin enhancer 2